MGCQAEKISIAGMFKRPTQCLRAFQYKKMFQYNQILQPGHGCILGSCSSLWTVTIPRLQDLKSEAMESPKGLETPGKRISSAQLGNF